MEKSVGHNFINGRISAESNSSKSGGAVQTGSYDATNDMPLGTIIRIVDHETLEEEVARLKEYGLPTCQIFVPDYTRETAKKLRAALDKYGIEPTCLITMGPGPYVWNFYEGPSTIGLVPGGRRAERLAVHKQGADFCAWAGIPAIEAHMGFIPENPNDPLYAEFVTTMRESALYARERGVGVWFETGQETPVALLRALLDVGTDNVGANLDTANVILYGKANPVDAIDVLGLHIKALHAKDGFYPTDPRDLGKQCAIGEGKVDFPELFRKLKEIRFKGHVTIEREIRGPQQIKDILAAKEYLMHLIRTV